MAKTCIVCGMKAGSGEHVFPAALGGRRINRGIYCTIHDNGYSSLVGELANQMAFFNSHLGVRPDHSKNVKSVFAQDPHTGQKLEISANEIKFADSRIISRQPTDKGDVIRMSFPSRESLNEWIAENKSNGIEFVGKAVGEAQKYYVDTVQHKLSFGGPCGLGAIAYIAQTFLAQEFPEVVRSGDVADFIAYTQAIAKVAKKGGCNTDKNIEADEELMKAKQVLAQSLSPWKGEAPVWWNLDQFESEPNTFDFGHRVTVGIDAIDGQIFGHFSLFSTLHFSIYFGKASSVYMSKTVIVDIDPMAEHFSNDIKKIEKSSAIGRVERPLIPTHGLAEAISSGSQEVVFNTLIKRMVDYALANLAKKMHMEVTTTAGLPAQEAKDVIRIAVESRSQQVLNLTKFVIQNFKSTLNGMQLAVLGPILDQMIAHDPSKPNGLSDLANVTLELAKSALIEQMKVDMNAGNLDERRIAELMGEWPGAEIVEQLILLPILNQFSH